jgi:MazG family protein
MAALRGDGGCPWDRAQTHRSLLPYLIEEAYELVDAVERDDTAHMRAELGDVLLQVVFHARIAQESGAFDFQDVAAELAGKLVARHPHVFGGPALATPEDVRKTWEQRKTAARESAMDGIPPALPALQRAAKAGARAASTGFDWRARGDIVAKIREEIDEFAAELAALGEESDGAAREALELEFGDLLFALVQLGRREHLDAETALRRATDKFMARFRHMEREMHDQGERPDAQSDAAWWRLWARAKAGAEP